MNKEKRGGWQGEMEVEGGGVWKEEQRKERRKRSKKSAPPPTSITPPSKYGGWFKNSVMNTMVGLLSTGIAAIVRRQAKYSVFIGGTPLIHE